MRLHLCLRVCVDTVCYQPELLLAVHKVGPAVLLGVVLKGG